MLSAAIQQTQENKL